MSSPTSLSAPVRNGLAFAIGLVFVGGVASALVVDSGGVDDVADLAAPAVATTVPGVVTTPPTIPTLPQAAPSGNATTATAGSGLASEASGEVATNGDQIADTGGMPMAGAGVGALGVAALLRRLRRRASRAT